MNTRIYWPFNSLWFKTSDSSAIYWDATSTKAMPRLEESTLSRIRRIESTCTFGSFLVKRFRISSSSTSWWRFLMNRVNLGPPFDEPACDVTSFLLSSISSFSIFSSLPWMTTSFAIPSGSAFLKVLLHSWIDWAVPNYSSKLSHFLASFYLSFLQNCSTPLLYVVRTFFGKVPAFKSAYLTREI